MLDLVIFDCDGVLVDSEVLSARVLGAALAEHGAEMDLVYFRRECLGRSFPKVAAKIRRDFGVALPEGFEAAYRARLLEVFETELRCTPGLKPVLSGMALPVCVATSSSPPRTARALQITGLAGRFEGRVFTASEVDHGKPAPDLFLLAASRCGADPGRCLVIEDSRPGLIAAQAAGMASLRYCGGAHQRDRPPQLTGSLGNIQDWSELPARLPGLFAAERSA